MKERCLLCIPLFFENGHPTSRTALPKPGQLATLQRKPKSNEQQNGDDIQQRRLGEACQKIHEKTKEQSDNVRRKADGIVPRLAAFLGEVEPS